MFYIKGTEDNWNRDSHEMTKNQFGVFEIILPHVNGQPAIVHDSKIKVSLVSNL
jgi:1,4-alpha-glucan branching enzyme